MTKAKPRLAVLVPYRPNGGPVGERYRWLWDNVKPRLEELGPVFTGEPRGSQWSRSEAVNVARERAGKGFDAFLVGDCDTVPEAHAVRRGVWWAMDTDGAVRPHGERFMLSKAGTLAFLQGGPAALSRKAADRHFERSHAGGGLLVITAHAFDEVGGYDESFKGWGYEDSDFNLRLLHRGAWDRLPGWAWHLWHGREDNKPLPASKQKYVHLQRRYARDIAAWGEDKGLANPGKVF